MSDVFNVQSEIAGFNVDHMMLSPGNGAAKKAHTQAKKTFNHNGKNLENAMDSEVLPKTVPSMYAEVKEA